MMQTEDLQSLSDDDLLASLSRVLRESRRVDAEFIAHIAEVDGRRLYAREAFPSMIQYCIEVLNLSEPEAYLRIAVARASRTYPVLLVMLADGRLHLSGIGLLARHLTPDNCESVLARAAHKSKRQIEELIAELAPKPDAPPVIRRLPAPVAKPVQLCPDKVRASEPAPPPPPPPRVEPLAPERYKVSFTASKELREKLEKLQAMMDKDLASAIEAAVTEKLERLEAKRYANVKRPRKTLEQTDFAPKSRYVPAAVRRFLWKRDAGQCRFVDRKGRRCPEHRNLEIHHEDPYGRGGAHDPSTMCLMCPAHNAHLSRQEYGKAGDRVSEPSAIYGTLGFPRGMPPAVLAQVLTSSPSAAP